MPKKSLLLFAIVVALAACQSPSSDSGKHYLTVSWRLAGKGARTILPAGYPALATYDVLLHPASGADFSQTGLGAGQTSWTFDYLAAVVYTITVTGRDSSGNVIAQGSGSADMSSAATQSPGIVLDYISSGPGTGQIHLTFDTSAGGTVTAPMISFTLFDPTGTAIASNANLSGDSPIFTYTNVQATVGTYEMFAKFYSGSQVAMKVDTVIVLQNVDTAATIVLRLEDFNDIYVPVTGLSLNQNTLNLTLGGDPYVLVASVSPANASNALVTWSSDNPGVGSAYGGQAAALVGGTMTITATSVDNPMAQASCTVDVYTTVTFDAQGGSDPSPVSIQVLYGLTYPALAATSKAGYSFGGWWTGLNGTGIQITDGATVTSNVNQTLYAYWIPIQ